GDHVGLCKITGRMKAVLQLPVEIEVDIDLVIEGTIERPHRRLTNAAGRLRGAGEQHQRRLLVTSPGSLEDTIPDILRIGQDARPLTAPRAQGGRGAGGWEGRAGAGGGGRIGGRPGSAGEAGGDSGGLTPKKGPDRPNQERRGEGGPPPADGDGDRAHACTA